MLALEQDPGPEVDELIDQRGWDVQVTTRADAVIGARDTRRDADFEIVDVPDE